METLSAQVATSIQIKSIARQALAMLRSGQLDVAQVFDALTVANKSRALLVLNHVMFKVRSLDEELIRSCDAVLSRRLPSLVTKAVTDVSLVEQERQIAMYLDLAKHLREWHAWFKGSHWPRMQSAIQDIPWTGLHYKARDGAPFPRLVQWAFFASADEQGSAAVLAPCVVEMLVEWSVTAVDWRSFFSVEEPNRSQPATNLVASLDSAYRAWYSSASVRHGVTEKCPVVLIHWTSSSSEAADGRPMSGRLEVLLECDLKTCEKMRRFWEGRDRRRLFGQHLAAQWLCCRDTSAASPHDCAEEGACLFLLQLPVRCFNRFQDGARLGPGSQWLDLLASFGRLRELVLLHKPSLAYTPEQQRKAQLLTRFLDPKEAQRAHASLHHRYLDFCNSRPWTWRPYSASEICHIVALECEVGDDAALRSWAGAHGWDTSGVDSQGAEVASKDVVDISSEHGHTTSPRVRSRSRSPRYISDDRKLARMMTMLPEPVPPGGHSWNCIICSPATAFRTETWLIEHLHDLHHSYRQLLWGPIGVWREARPYEAIIRNIVDMLENRMCSVPSCYDWRTRTSTDNLLRHIKTNHCRCKEWQIAMKAVEWINDQKGMAVAPLSAAPAADAPLPASAALR